MENNINYHLVLEARPKDFMPIDINELLDNQSRVDYHKIEKIDEFTKGYTLEELYELIKKNNLVPDYYLDGKLEIINDNKYRYMVMTKDINFSIDSFFEQYLDNKLIMNKFLNIYIKYCSQTQEKMKEAIKNKDVNLILDTLFRNSYESVRSIYIYVYQNIISNS